MGGGKERENKSESDSWRQMMGEREGDWGKKRTFV